MVTRGVFSVAALVLAMMVVALMAGCERGERAGAVGDLVLGESDSGKVVALGEHKSVLVNVYANASTGYGWSVKVEGDALEEAGAEEVGRPATMPGSGSTIAYRFRPVKAGRATIKMAYARPWEKDVPPVQTLTVTVVVDKVAAR